MNTQIRLNVVCQKAQNRLGDMIMSIGEIKELVKKDSRKLSPMNYNLGLSLVLIAS